MREFLLKVKEQARLMVVRVRRHPWRAFFWGSTAVAIVGIVTANPVVTIIGLIGQWIGLLGLWFLDPGDETMYFVNYN